MLEDAIREVRIKVRTDLSSAAEAIRPAAERVVRAVLERCAGLLEQRAPGRVELIARLPLHWRFDDLDAFAAEEPGHIDDLARAAVDVIERLAMAAPAAAAMAAGTPVPDIVFFDDEAHLRASQLLALTAGRRAWFDAIATAVNDRDPWATLGAPEHRALAEATLRRLARDGALADALGTRDGEEMAALATVLRVEPPPIAAGTKAADGDGLAGTLAAIVARWPTLAPAARRLALRVHAAVLLERDLDAADVVALAAAVDGITAQPHPEPEKASPREGPHAHQAAAPPEEPPPAEPSPTIVTECAGVFYLLDRLQELDIPESLWTACLPEGIVLSAAAAALLGNTFEGDPAPGLFGGVERLVPCPDVTRDQHVEFARATCAQMAAALPRRGIAGIPGVVVTLVDRASGRLLIASVEGCPFTFFAWPAPTPDLVREGLRTLLALWPASAPITASPALTTLDSSGRLRPWRSAPRPAWLVPEAPSSSTSALLATVAGAPATLLAWRAGDVASDRAEAFVARRLARRARVGMTPDRMDVILDAADIDLDLRRAALDRDPGWLPWLRRWVRFTFAGLETLEQP